MSSQSFKEVKGKPDLLYKYFLLSGGYKVDRDSFYSLLHFWFNLIGQQGHSAIIESKVIAWLKEKYDEKDS